MPQEDYFVKLIGTRPGWPDNMTADEERIMSEHYDYLVDLVRKKKVLIAGPVFDPTFGMIVLKTSSEEEARSIMDNEPSVAQGVHSYEIQPMKVSLQVEHFSPDRYVNNSSQRILKKTARIGASVENVWQAWTTTEGLITFFASAAHTELKPGGPFEIYFNRQAELGSQGSEGCRILSYAPLEMLSFEWNAPPDFGPLRGQHTQVVIQFSAISKSQTELSLSHMGWGQSTEWDRLYDYFNKAWPWVFDNCNRRFESGLIDWSSR